MDRFFRGVSNRLRGVREEDTVDSGSSAREQEIDAKPEGSGLSKGDVPTTNAPSDQADAEDSSSEEKVTESAASSSEQSGGGEIEADESGDDDEGAFTLSEDGDVSLEAGSSTPRGEGTITSGGDASSSEVDGEGTLTFGDGSSEAAGDDDAQDETTSEEADETITSDDGEESTFTLSGDGDDGDIQISAGGSSATDGTRDDDGSFVIGADNGSDGELTFSDGSDDSDVISAGDSGSTVGASDGNNDAIVADNGESDDSSETLPEPDPPAPDPEAESEPRPEPEPEEEPVAEAVFEPVSGYVLGPEVESSARGDTDAGSPYQEIISREGSIAGAEFPGGVTVASSGDDDDDDDDDDLARVDPKDLVDIPKVENQPEPGTGPPAPDLARADLDVINTTAVAGDSEAGEPSKVVDGAEVSGDPDAGDPMDLVSSGDADAGPPMKAVESEPTAPLEFVQTPEIATIDAAIDFATQPQVEPQPTLVNAELSVPVVAVDPAPVVQTADLQVAAPIEPIPAVDPSTDDEDDPGDGE